MASLLLVLVSLVSFLAPTPPAPQTRMPEGTSTISGRVIADNTGKPIAHAAVDIVIWNNLSGGFKRVFTDDQGHFELTKLPASRYQIAASAPRYARMQYGQQAPGPAGLMNPPRVIDLKDGESFSNADFTLAAFCAIEGTVTDEFGDPAPNVVIQASQVQYAAGVRGLMPANLNVDLGPPRPTDDHGHFRIAGLPPGTYYIEALAGAFADPNAAGGFAITFYPGTTDASGARAVTLKNGIDAVGVNFTLTPGPSATIGGIIQDGSGAPVPGANLVLMPARLADLALTAMMRGVATEIGGFTFRNVPAGTYTIQAFGRPPAGASLAAAPFGYLTVSVAERDLDHVVITIPPPRTIRGHITFDDTSVPAPAPADVRFSAPPVEFESAPIMGGGPPPTIVRDDWTFEIGAMSGMRRIQGGGAGWIVKSVFQGGRDVTDAALDLREKDVNDIDVTLTRRLSAVTGTVVTDDHKPLTDYNVVIFADDETKWGVWSRYVVSSRTNSTGIFSVRGLPPGSYVAIPLATLLAGEWQDPAFLRAQQAKQDAVRFTLGDGGTQAVQLIVRK